jgi:tRNA modification GTPase
MTAAGRGAIAVVRVWGPEAIRVADTAFRPDHGAGLAVTPRGDLRFGRIGDGRGDEVIVAVLDGNEPTVEVQCHGGTAAVALIVAALEKAGAQRRDLSRCPEQVSRDRLAALALLDLARAPTLATAEILLDQAHGALRGDLIQIGRSIEHEPEQAVAELETLIDRARVGLRLLDGWKVVIIGRPNVGKSRLFNALAGFERAIVDAAPGTTRDIVSLSASFGGWPVELADTAGLREAFDPIESIGIERSHRAQREADLTLVVLDRSQRLQPIDQELIATNPVAIVASNKSDLPSAWDECARGLQGRAVMTVSAQTGNGLTELIDAITRRLVPHPPPRGAGVPFRREQVHQIRQMRSSLLAGDRAAALRKLASMIQERERPDEST